MKHEQSRKGYPALEGCKHWRRVSSIGSFRTKSFISCTGSVEGRSAALASLSKTRKNAVPVGDIINHGKYELWGKPGVHYHNGMAAGQNTLNALCTRVVTRGMAEEKGYSVDRFLQDYVKFMTTPGSHDDTYAGKHFRLEGCYPHALGRCLFTSWATCQAWKGQGSLKIMPLPSSV